MKKRKSYRLTHITWGSVYIDPESGLSWEEGESHSVDEDTARRILRDAPNGFTVNPPLEEEVEVGETESAAMIEFSEAVGGE